MMKKDFSLFFAVLFSLLVVGLAACTTPVPLPDIATPTLPTSPAPAQITYSDPFSYCAAIGTIDTPDARFTGPKISDEIINGFIAAAGLEASTAPMEIFKQTTIWRCMDSQVVVCNFGANLPCSSKANIDKTPSPEMQEYCNANPDSDFIPMSVTGHDTIYSWHCIKDAPQVLEQIAQVDAAGYLANIWYRIAPGASPKPAISATSTSIPSSIVNPTGGSNQILFASNRGGDYDDHYLLDLASWQVTRLNQGDSKTFPAPFSPDGSRIAFVSDRTNTAGINNLYVMNTDGSNVRRLTKGSEIDYSPAWSPDGAWIAFSSHRDGASADIYLIRPDGTGMVNLTNNPAEDWAPVWSPDGALLAFQTNRDGNWEIYIMNADGSNPRNLTQNPANDQMPYWSPSALPSPGPVASPTSTMPAPTFTPAATFTPSVPTIVARMDTNCRSGPNLLYPRVGYLLVGQQSTVHGRNASHTWWYIANLNRAGQYCWVWADTTSVSGNVAGLPVITPPPLPKATDFTLSFSNLHVCGGVTYMIFRVKNTGNDTFWSSSITIRDITHDQGFSGPENSNTPFIPTAGACPPGVKQLPGGATAYVAKGIGTSLPSGTKMRGIIVLCTKPSLGGACVEHKVNFVFP